MDDTVVPARMKRLLIIDLQMPIRDGYSATHAIRTEAPFKDLPDVRNVPIVAMTASAIQGDKEKCQQAGMDVSVPQWCHWCAPAARITEMLMFSGLFSEACQRQAVGENAGTAAGATSQSSLRCVCIC